MTPQPYRAPFFDKEANTNVVRESDVCKRPTLSPPFDLAAFAKEKMLDREAERRFPSEAPTEPGLASLAASVAAPISGRRTRPDVFELDESCCLERLGSLTRTPTVTMAAQDIRLLALDHRAGFVLAHIDGVSTLELVLDVSGMPRLETLRHLVGFLADGIIRVA